jgi:hypothetical protein
MATATAMPAPHTPQIALIRKMIAVAMHALQFACRRSALDADHCGVSRLHRSVFFQRLESALRRKVPLGNAAIVLPHKRESSRFWPTRRSLPRLSTHAPTCSMDQSCALPLWTLSTGLRSKRRAPLPSTAFSTRSVSRGPLCVAIGNCGHCECAEKW